jgi:abortive infection alpha-like protein
MGARDSLFAGLRAVEAAALGLLRRRMDQAAALPAPAAAAPLAAAAPSPPALLRDLLERSMAQSREETRTALFVRLLGELLPDEARILAALSDGTTYPLIHVEAGPRLGAATRRVLAHVSSVGKSAGVAWADMTPAYVGRLVHLGLAELGPEDETHEVKYEILEADETVRAAIERIRKADRQRESIVRRVVRISDLGRALWAACAMDGT